MADGQDPDLLRRAILESTITVEDLIESEVGVLAEMSKAIESTIRLHEERLTASLAKLNIIDPSGEACESECQDEVPRLRAFSTELRGSVIGVARRILGRVLKNRAKDLESGGEKRGKDEEVHEFLERVDSERVLKTGESWERMEALVDLRNLLEHASWEGEILQQDAALHARLQEAFGAHGLVIRGRWGVSEVILGNGLTDVVIEDLRSFVRTYLLGS